MTEKEALKLAIRAMKSFQEGTGGLYKGEFDEEIKTCEEALAQLEQEPVAKVCHDLDGHIGWNPKLTQLPDEGILFYTTPPQRKPLTDEQAHQTLLKMAKHIETFGEESTTEEQLSGECIRFILEQVDAHGIKE